jgi:segregation and condensation protein B
MAVLDALLFSAPRPLSAAALARLTGLATEDVVSLLKELEAVYDRPEHGVRLAQVAEGYQLVTHHRHHAYVEKLRQEKSREQVLSQPALETLSIIAYCQPVTRARIEAIRGVKSDHVLSGLLERGLIQEAGRGDGPGRPVLFATTKGFLEYFGLKDLNELPALDQVKAGPGKQGEAVGGRRPLNS